jgi:predicted  nucleic acid-binding Zn-ribbon protein
MPAAELATEPSDILDTLCRLQSLDDEIRDTKERRQERLTHLDRLRRVLAAMTAELDTQRGKLAEFETHKAKKQFELDAERDKLNKAKGKLAGVQRQKEYLAARQEQDNISKRMHVMEDDVVNLESAIEDFRAAIAKKEQSLRDCQSEASQAESEVQTIVASIDAKIAEVDVRRKVFTSRLERGVIARYEKIAAARGGRAIVPIVDSSCTGCHMGLQPRFVEIIMRSSSLMQCPHCSRYLYAQREHDADGQVIVRN